MNTKNEDYKLIYLLTGQNYAERRAMAEQHRVRHKNSIFKYSDAYKANLIDLVKQNKEMNILEIIESEIVLNEYIDTAAKALERSFPKRTVEKAWRFSSSTTIHYGSKNPDLAYEVTEDYINLLQGSNVDEERAHKLFHNFALSGHFAGCLYLRNKVMTDPLILPPLDEKTAHSIKYRC
jgi:hypothetical protein